MRESPLICGISGTHGTGKSTVIKALIHLGYDVDQTQLSREVQKKLGWSTLADATATVDSTIAFQEAILEALYDRNVRILSGQYSQVFVERTPADLFAYAKWWINERHKCTSPIAQSWLDGYKNRCRTLQADLACTMILLPHQKIPFEPDPNRASLENREFIKVELDDFIINGGLPHIHVTKLKPEDRAAQCISALTCIKMKGQHVY